ncbi:MAG: T9SS type A sorting domain-containing protein [Paludibacter sp.]|nr:T9SS type A sorting domain-containing protein [Paludibacter sp.]
MKKITFFVFGLLIASTVFSENIQRKWNGSQTDQLWDYATANWLDPSFTVPLPKTFVEGADAIFDDTSVDGSDTIKLSGNVLADSVFVNGTKTYVIRYTDATDSIKGTGALVKNGEGTFVMDVVNDLEGGTVLKNGELVMEKYTSNSIFGAILKFEGGTAVFAENDSKNYPEVSVSMEIPEGQEGAIRLPRYCNWQSPLSGKGDLHIYAGGDRNYLGKKSKNHGDWSNFEGNVQVDKNTNSSGTPGFKGLVFEANKTFKDSLQGFNIDSIFYNRRLTLGPEVTIASESGVKAYAIGELQAVDTTSVLAGYYKKSNSPKVYYFIGGLNTDVVFPGRIAQANGITTHYNHVGIYKVGTGTYTFTNSDNDIIGGVIVREGGLLVCDKNLRGTYRGGIGNWVNVEENGMLGGTGRIMGDVTVAGKLEPGNNGVGTLMISDSLSAAMIDKYDRPFSYSFSYIDTTSTSATVSNKFGGTGSYNLNLNAGSVAEFQINTVENYDQVVASGKLKFQIDTISAGKPKIKIAMDTRNGFIINDGDQFEIIKARSLDANSSGFDIEYPTIEGVTWSVEAKYDTVSIDKETYTFTDHVITATNADSTAITTVEMDSVIVNYKVIVTAHGSASASEVNTPSKTMLKVYPNPVRGAINFNAGEDIISSVSIINMQGQVVLNKNVNAATTRFSVADLAPGIYYAKVLMNGETKVEKLILK